MTRKELLGYIAPCSLLCYTCPGLKDGAISQCAKKLCGYFEGYYDFNESNLPEENRSWLADFEKFRVRLGGYTQSDCPGCRNSPVPGQGCIPGCVVPECAERHGVDFCAECGEFPCENARAFYRTVNDVIGEDWERGSRRIREIGMEAYFEEKKETSHYISYRKEKRK